MNNRLFHNTRLLLLGWWGRGSSRASERDIRNGEDISGLLFIPENKTVPKKLTKLSISELWEMECVVRAR